MAAAAPNEWLMTLLMLLASGLGLPVGVPPEPGDETLMRIAPDSCLYFSAWAGTADPDPESGNQTEQLLAEPEIRQLLDTFEQQLGSALQQAAGREQNAQRQVLLQEAPKLLKILMTHPAAIFVADIEPNPQAPKVDAGIVVRVGEQADEVRRSLQRLQDTFARGEVQRLDLADFSFQRVQPGAKFPPITWGVRGEYLVIGLGDGSVEGILERARTDPPEWVRQFEDQIPVGRVSTVTYVNVGSIWDKLAPLAGPEATKIVGALGLDGIRDMGSVTGLDETGFLSRALIRIDGPPAGLLKLADVAPLQAEDLGPIPGDALVALAFRLDAGQLMDLVRDIAGRIEPRAAEKIDSGLAEIEGQLGFRIRDELLASLGDVWTVATAPADGGLITGWTATVQLRDRARIEEIHRKLLDVAARAFGDRPRAPQIKRMTFAGRELYYLVTQDDDFPLSPCWCLTDSHLVVAPFPQAVKALLARGEAASTPSLAVHPKIARVLEAQPGPMKVFYVDSREVFRMLYPVVQVVAQVGMTEARRRGVDLDPALLPSPRTIDRHLLPLVIAVRRTESGIEIISHQSLPGGNVAAAAPAMTALLLPAIQAAREAARRTQSMNNLKQIAIAMHNYHDIYRAFPAAYSTDKEGKPLLSWRVHILPYIEQYPLYKEFHLDEPWDSEHNRALIARMPAAYRAPGSGAGPGKTNYLGIAGEGNIFVSPKSKEGAPLGTGMREITDGTSNTAMVVEASDDLAVTWTQPKDFEPNPDQPLRGLVGVRPGGFLAALCDGSVRFIAASIDPQMLKALFTRAGGEAVRLP